MKSGKGVAALERRTGWRGTSLTRVGQAVKLCGGDKIIGDVVGLRKMTYRLTGVRITA